MPTYAKLSYFTDPQDGSKPWRYANAMNVPDGARISNHEHQQRSVDIENVRGNQSRYTLDGCGFEFVMDAPTRLKNFGDDTGIKEVYYPESAQLIKDITGASKVLIFDHTLRRRRIPGETVANPDVRPTAGRVHVDQTPSASIARVHRHIASPEEAEDLLTRRFQILNLWRPINHPAFDSPLALCDFRSVDVERDLVAVELVYPLSSGETYEVRWSPKHEWKFLRGMRLDEAVLFKCYDSVQDGSVATLTPHTAFDDPEAPKEGPPRESIELRVLAFYD
ncbi:hypothetical protein V5O48_016399 [Marasmius crinis-equi]|uniref:Methyltransferase n=1 Tax=Marasmius crinis-equi TaxID=585013 RepID=A0ABR3ERU9_9AGAR